MFGSTILDVAIGMVFVYSVFSMVATKINDIVASWLKWRAKSLQDGIRTLLADPELANKVWNHSLVQGLVGKNRKVPSYIPPNTLALALFDAIAPAGGESSGLDKVHSKVMEMPDNSARQALLALIEKANGDIDKAVFQATDWFDSAMDRVSNLYKSRMQTLSIVVALAVSVIFNADSFAIANGLWQEPTLRAAVAGAATRTAQSNQSVSAAQTNEQVQGVIASVSQLGLPIGWTALPSTLGAWVQKILGLALTTLAVSLGAPFWYDILKHLSSLRQQQSDSRQTASASS